MTTIPNPSPRHVEATHHTTSTPSARPWVETPLDLDAIATWNAANRRAIDEYAIHPFAACSHAGSCKKERP